MGVAGDLLLVLGIGLVVAGVALWSVPAALIFAGFALVAFAVVLFGEEGEKSADSAD